MSVTATQNSSATGSAATSLTAPDAAGSSDRFLKLLVAQMQNQDPLNPMDNAQVTSQMAQINTVNGIEKLNTTVGSLSTQFVQLQALQGASLVGHDVVVAGNKMDIADGIGQGGFQLDTAADAVKVEVLSGAGQVIETLDLGAQTDGMHGFDWKSGAATADQGITFRVTATRGGVASAATPLMRDKVDAVSTSGNTLNLELANSGTVSYASIKAFN